MPTTLEKPHLPALARGCALLGSGGGGTTVHSELMLQITNSWPIEIFDADEIDPTTACVAAGFAGSTVLMTERIPGNEPFDALIRAAERWTGVSAGAVCSIEVGGMNGLAPLALGRNRSFIDADLMGRALPRIDQFSLLVDEVPKVVIVCGAESSGIVLAEGHRPADIERVVRSAIVQAGGSAGVVVAGFTVGELRAHAVRGSYTRALALGVSFLAHASAPIAQLAASLGGRELGSWRIASIEHDKTDPYVSSIEIAGARGEVFRIVAGSEALAFLANGRVEAVTPEIIVTLDSVSRDILEVHSLSVARNVSVLALPAPAWWVATPTRRAAVAAASYGLRELDAR